MLAAGPAAATDVRAWDHGDYGRLVVDWGRPVGYRVDVSDTRIVIDFDRPVDSRLGAVTSRLAAYVSAAEFADDRKEVVLTLRQPVTAHDFVLDSRVVFDLRPDPGSKPEASTAEADRKSTRLNSSH